MTREEQTSAARAVRARLGTRLATRLGPITDEMWAAIESREEPYRRLPLPLREEVRSTIRWAAELFVRTVVDGTPVPDGALVRLRQFGTDRALNGTPLSAVLNAVRSAMRVGWEALVTEAGTLDLDETALGATGAMTAQLAGFTSLVCDSMEAGHTAAGPSAHTVVRHGATARTDRPSVLLSGAVDRVGPLNDTSPPYVAFVLLPVTGTASDTTSEVIAQFSVVLANVVEGGRFDEPVPHVVLVAARMEPWRVKEVRNASATIATQRGLLVVHSPPARSVDRLQVYCRIARDRLAATAGRLPDTPRTVPLAALALDAVIESVPERVQVDFITSLFGDGLGPPVDRAMTLVDTVRAVVAAGGSGSAARELVLHRHGVRYRLTTLTALGGRDPSVPQNRAGFLVALRALDLRPRWMPPLGDAAWHR